MAVGFVCKADDIVYGNLTKKSESWPFTFTFMTHKQGQDEKNVSCIGIHVEKKREVYSNQVTAIHETGSKRTSQFDGVWAMYINSELLWGVHTNANY